jgi:molybdopterin molybdotransferase
MLSVSEALHLVLEHAHTRQPGEAALSEAIGLILAEDVASDIDSPPHDKAMVDGYAVRGADLVEGRAELTVLEEVTAGDVPKRPVTPGCATRVMTGAPMPEGAEAMVMVERTEFLPRDASLPTAASASREAVVHLGVVLIQDEAFRAGQNVMRRATSLREGDIVLRPGTEIGPAEIGLLAEVGRSRVLATGPVRVAVLSTGNELVPPEEKPGPGQIRNSNGPMLAAAVRQVGAIPYDLGIAQDDADELRLVIASALECDAVILSGGVSAGVLDLVPKVLADLGVRQVFHKVHLKPGKPIWFGVAERSASSAHGSPLVFGLPGNPVSSLVCFELFVKPALARIAGKPWQPPHPMRIAKLTRDFSHRGDRPTYHPAKLIESSEGLLVEPTTWHGSADLRGLTGADALIHFPPGDRQYAPGEEINVLVFK